MVTRVQRDSNAELLRIICMFFIVLHHFLVNSAFPGTLLMSVPLDSGIVVSTFANGFLFVGVICFVLISGYYGIHLHLRGVWRLFSMVVFYGLAIYLFDVMVSHKQIDYAIFTQSILVFSHSWWWFLNCYVMLMCLSPLLNSGIDNMSRKEHLIVIGLLTLLQVYFGFFWQTYQYDSDGFSIINMIYIYVIGAYIRRFVSKRYLSDHRWHWLAAYIVCALVWAGLTILAHGRLSMSWWKGFTYNNPVLICSALGLFLFVMSFHLVSKPVNMFAGGVFAVYLVQESTKVKGQLYSCVQQMCEGHDVCGRFTLVLVLSIAFMAAVLMFDRLRVILMGPIDKLIFKEK